MAKCMSCRKTALLTTNFGNVTLCKNCGSLASVPVWNKREFASLDDLIYQKNDALQKATANNMPQGIVSEITRFFDEYINAGFITSVKGKAGQSLKVFSTHCIITTKNESKKASLENLFPDFEDDDNDEEALISSDDKRNLVKGLMSGKLVQTGIGVAISATLNQQEKEKTAEKKSRERRQKVEQLISVGERRIDLKSMSSVEIYSSSSSTNGYLKFIPKGVSSKQWYSCEYFFFNNSIPFEGKKIRQQVDSIKNTLNELIANADREIQLAMAQAEQEQIKLQQLEKEEQERKMVKITSQQNKPDEFEEIRKFKQLLDEGIISEEEFNVKKKELLGL